MNDAPTYLEYATFKRRFAAKLIDLFIIELLSAPVIALCEENHIDDKVFSVVNAFFLVAYSSAFLEKFGATPGKMLVGIKVLKPDGTALSGMQPLVRTLAEWLSCAIVYFGYLNVLVDAERRAWHDMIANTRVFKVR